MKKKNAVLDTNLIIRFLTQDVPSQARKVRSLFQQSPDSSLEIPDVIIAEVIYVLIHYYKLPKKEIVEKLSKFIEYKKFKLNYQLIKKSLDIYAENNISYVDSYVCSLTILKKNSHIYSFDKQLTKIREASVQEP